jgi:hypothetical protein
MIAVRAADGTEHSLYTPANCVFSFPLSWARTVFWRQPIQ